MKYCSVNGEQQDIIALNDRGLSYGDGLFSTAKIVNGNVVLLAKHIERLMMGCQQLKITPPVEQVLIKELQSVAKGYAHAVLKVMITAGSGGRGYSRVGLADNASNVIIIVSDYPQHYNTLAKQGIILGDSEQKMGINPMLSGLKHLNRLEQVLLRAELDKRQEDDLVVSNCHDHIIEVTCANLFYKQGSQWYTPDLSLSGVNGLIRQAILTKYPKFNVRLTHSVDLREANSMFICNSLMGIMPVKTYNNRNLAIDDVLQIQSQMQGLI
jgi:4-amino-4-deoxychorismate lyase